MRICIYLYSATGNTRKVTRACADELTGLGHEVDTVDLVQRPDGGIPQPEGYDMVGFAFPVMVFRTPYTTKTYLDKLKPLTNPVKAFILTTCAGMGANTEAVFSSMLAGKGFEVVAAEEVICQDSYIPFRKWFSLTAKKGKPGVREEEQARRFARSLSKDQGGEFAPRSGLVRSGFGVIGAKASVDAGRKMLGPRWLDSEACTGCGLCVELCPTGALAMGEGDLPTARESRCIGCCACFNRCPESAWRLKKFAPKYFYKGPG